MKKLLKILFVFMLIPSIFLGCNDLDNIIKPNPNNTNEETIESNENNPKDNDTTQKDNDTTPQVKVEQREVRLFYYDSVANITYYKDTTIEVTDKAVVTALINALKKPLIEGVDPLLSEEVAVRSAKLDTAKNILTVDIRSRLVDPEKIGGGIEGNIIDALVNTLGYNYKVEKVIITLDGKPYESGHFALEKDEAFTVDYSNTVEHE